VDSDGCTDCFIDDGYTCPIIGQPCETICGDDLLKGDEDCEDGNSNDNDGCEDCI